MCNLLSRDGRRSLGRPPSLMHTAVPSAGGRLRQIDRGANVRMPNVNSARSMKSSVGVRLPRGRPINPPPETITSRAWKFGARVRDRRFHSASPKGRTDQAGSIGKQRLPQTTLARSPVAGSFLSLSLSLSAHNAFFFVLLRTVNLYRRSDGRRPRSALRPCPHNPWTHCRTSLVLFRKTESHISLQVGACQGFQTY